MARKRPPIVRKQEITGNGCAQKAEQPSQQPDVFAWLRSQSVKEHNGAHQHPQLGPGGRAVIGCPDADKRRQQEDDDQRFKTRAPHGGVTGGEPQRPGGQGDKKRPAPDAGLAVPPKPTDCRAGQVGQREPAAIYNTLKDTW